MFNQGSGSNGEWTFLDVLSLASFLIGLQNLDINISQSDMQEMQQHFNDLLEKIVTELHEHLEVQDEKLNMIIERLGL